MQLDATPGAGSCNLSVLVIVGNAIYAGSSFDCCSTNPGAHVRVGGGWGPEYGSWLTEPIMR